VPVRDGRCVKARMWCATRLSGEERALHRTICGRGMRAVRKRCWCGDLRAALMVKCIGMASRYGAAE
jgi:hypothetical protein